MKTKTDYAYQDPSTRDSLRSIVLPRLRSELESLIDCERQCAERQEWFEDWESAGMLEDTKSLKLAIQTIEGRLASHSLRQVNREIL